MVGEFKQEWGIILGGSSGLGLATALKLAQEGMNICIVHRDPRSNMTAIEQHFETIKSQKVEFISYNLDAISEEKQLFFMQDFKTIIKENKVKVLVHSLAKGSLKSIIDEPKLTFDDFQITLNAMALSLISWVQKLHENDFFGEDSRIISFSSEGSSKVIPNYAAVSLAKASLENLSRYIAVEMAKYGIKSNIIQAGVTDTQALRMMPNHDKILKMSLLRNPYKRLTTPEDVAHVVYLLSKKEAFWINGSVIKVDGGESIV